MAQLIAAGANRGRIVSPWRTPAYRALHQDLASALGAATAKALASLQLYTVGDLLGHLPRRYLSGTETTDLETLRPGDDAAIVARVARVEVIAGRGGASRNGRRSLPRDRLEAILSDGRGSLKATFFGKPQHVRFWSAQLGLGIKGIFVGKVTEFNHSLQMTHPNFVMLDAAGRIVGRADPDRVSMASHVSRAGLVGLYPATSKIPTWQVGECAGIVLDALADLPDPMPEYLRRAHDLPALMAAYTQVHRPDTAEAAEAGVERLKWDEALALQVTMARRRADAVRSRAAALKRVPDGLLTAFDERLPFELTDGQRAIGEEIFAELARERPMQRLLQGEVGSGKTVVALRALLAAVDAGYQGVLLAPTEVLAAQHHASICRLLGDLGAGRVLGAPEQATEVVLLTGSMGVAQRRAVLAKAADGTAGIVVGTHALLGDRVQFAGLGLVVIDEQHRFGVEQRAVLQGRAGPVPHLLVLTATPIPRTIAMSVFGDLEVATLREIPAGRQPVQTTVVDTRIHPAWLDRAWQRVREEVAAGHQVFVVAPRISSGEPDPAAGSDAEPSAAVAELAAQLAAGPLAGLRLGLLHGQLTRVDKEQTMADFAAGQLDVLVATTVIEVGVDVPNATMMIVMDADRFGISQLHQLRGRIGRGSHPGVCLLVTGTEPDSSAARRLAAVARTGNGFELAELDLALRREGDVLGSAQTGGRSTLRLLRVLSDAHLIAAARDVAEELVGADPEQRDDWLADMVTAVQCRADGQWLERT